MTIRPVEAPPAGSIYTAPNGDRVQLFGESLDFTLPWSGAISCLKPPNGRFAFQTGPIGMADNAMLDYPDFRFSERYEYQGGALRIGSTPIDDAEVPDVQSGPPGSVRLWVATWEAQHYCVYTVERATEDVQLRLIAQFDNLILSETETGIVVDGRPNLGVEMFGVTLTKEIPSLGLLNITDARETGSSVLPQVQGAPVPGGELFVSDDHSHFVLASTSAVTIIQPARDGEAIDDPKRLDLLAQLRVEWRPRQQARGDA